MILAVYWIAKINLKIQTIVCKCVKKQLIHWDKPLFLESFFWFHEFNI